MERSRTGWQEFYPSARSPARTPPLRAYFARGALAATSPLVQAEHLVHGLVEPRAELGESLRAAGLFQDFFVTVRVGDSPWHD